MLSYKRTGTPHIAASSVSRDVQASPGSRSAHHGSGSGKDHWDVSRGTVQINYQRAWCAPDEPGLSPSPVAAQSWDRRLLAEQICPGSCTRSRTPDG